MADADTAYSQRDKRYNISALAIWEDDGNPQRHIQWSRNLAARIEPLSGGGAAYVNYLNDDASPDEVKDAYATERYRRLRALKAKYDPPERLPVQSEHPARVGRFCSALNDHRARRRLRVDGVPAAAWPVFPSLARVGSLSPYS